MLTPIGCPPQRRGRTTIRFNLEIVETALECGLQCGSSSHRQPFRPRRRSKDRGPAVVCRLRLGSAEAGAEALPPARAAGLPAEIALGSGVGRAAARGHHRYAMLAQHRPDQPGRHAQPRLAGEPDDQLRLESVPQGEPSSVLQPGVEACASLPTPTASPSSRTPARRTAPGTPANRWAPSATWAASAPRTASCCGPGRAASS